MTLSGLFCISEIYADMQIVYILRVIVSLSNLKIAIILVFSNRAITFIFTATLQAEKTETIFSFDQMIDIFVEQIA